MSSLPLPSKRQLFFTSQVDQESIATLTKEIAAINESDRLLEKLYGVYNLEYTPAPIVINIDSYGGAVYQCFGLLSLIENSKTPVHTLVTGCAMSCGFLIAMHGHERFAYSNATLMYHQVSASTGGTLKEMEDYVFEVKRLQDKIEDMTLAKTNISKEKLQKVFKNKTDWYMDPKEALKFGVIDKII